ncbi:tetratricopeptide repeat protein 6 [Hemicordylus capensis]|uniref:tetratricopeptide repeat protein 6 n=1 Tax=Hemicordylus capensis TaxID=884348 RepID=UPI0023034F1C|nr:tetratricopeptide repeat protein 6 [Hemicordylus capensis]
MARKHEHFGLSYLEELIILKERENICKESRREFLKFKQETATAATNPNQLTIMAPDQSLQVIQPDSSWSSKSPSLFLESPNTSPELDTSRSPKKIRISPEVIDTKNQIQDFTAQQKKYLKKQDIDDKKQNSGYRKSLGYRSDSQKDEGGRLPVAITSLVGTNKKVTILKKSELPPKPKYKRFIPTRTRNKPVTLQKYAIDTDTEQKISPHHIIPVAAETSTTIIDTDDTYSVAFSTSETPKISKEMSKTNIPSSLLELEKTHSKKDHCSSSLKYFPEDVEESIGKSRLDISRVSERHVLKSRSRIHASVQKLSSGMIPRSIDEIIASLQSTSPTPSDLRIKELLESVLGQDYSIKMEILTKHSAEMETKDELLIYSPQTPAIKTETQPEELESQAEEATPVETEQIKPSLDIGKEPWTIDFEYPAAQVAPGEAEYTKLDIPRSSQRAVVLLEATKVEDDTAKVEAQEVITETPGGKAVSVVTMLSEDTSSLQESEVFSSSEVQEAQEPASLKPEKVPSEDLEESVSVLEVKGKAYPKTKLVEIQKSLEFPEHQPLSLLSTWTTKIKDVDYPLIHHLCTACPSCVLPVGLQLVSRVHHTSDKTGHNVLLPPFNLGYHESECEELFPATAAFEKQMRKERICNEGLPVSEVYECSQKDGIKVLPVHSTKSMPEWQRIAEFYVEKPKLELLGEQVKLHPGSLKMFWTPAPQKFSAPLSVMKKTLFPKYESNMINGVIYEDFSCDLREQEESESEDDFDALLSSVKVSRRCHSCPELDASETLEEDLVGRSVSAPELSSYRDKTALKIDANFKTTMEEMNVMKKQVPLPEAERSPASPQKSSPSPQKSTSLQKSSPSPKKNPPKGPLSPPKGPLSPPKGSLSPPKGSPSTPKGSLSPQKGSPSIDKDADSVVTVKSPKECPSKNAEDTASALALLSRKAGIPYIVFPKRSQIKKSKKAKAVTYNILEFVCEKLNQPPSILERTTSLGMLHSHNKFCIKVSPAVRFYRSPSLPCYLNFEKFAEDQGGIPENCGGYVWAKIIWNKWFDELYPPSRPPSGDKDKTDKKDVEKQTVTKEKDLTDSVNPLMMESEMDTLELFQSEIDRLTRQIEENPSSPFNYCRRGAIYRKTGKLKAAMDDVEKAISLEPMLVNAYWHRHLLLLYQNKILPALEDLNFIIKCNKNNADAYLSRADIYKRQGDNSLAIINYTLAMRCRPTDDEIYYRRGEVHEENGDMLMAIDDYAKCFYYNPRRTDALMKHGKYYFEKSNWVVAINDFTAVIKEDPNHAEARTFRGRVYIKQEKYKNAAEDFAAAIHLNPCNWIAYYHRGCILRIMKPKQALQDFSISVLLNHSYDNINAYLHRGILYAELKQWILAICDFETALVLDRSITSAYINIGLILMLHLDQYFESIQQFTNAIQVDPLNIRPYVCRAKAYHKIHDLKSAVKDINRAIHLQPNSPHLCLTRGQYLLEMKNYELATFCIHQVAEIGQGSLECSLVQEALVQSFCQNHNKAIECALAASKKQPEASMIVLLGKIQMKAKKYKDAVAAFKQALKLLPTKTASTSFEAAEMYYFIGLCHMEQVSLLQASDAFSAAVKLYPRYADALYQRGLCRMQLQQAKAILDFNKVLAVAPTHFQAYLSRAAYYGSKGRYSKAIVNCTEAIKIHSKSVRAYLYRGTLKFYNRTYELAIEDLTKAIEVDNTCILAYYNRAIIYHQIKDYKKALKDYGIVLLLDATKDIILKVLINRALLYAQLDQHAYALEDLTEVTLSKPKDSQLFKVIGTCYYRLQKYEESVNSFSKVLKLDPFCLDGYIGRGNSYLEYGHEEGTKNAQKDFSRAIHLNPMCTKARLCLGYNLQALGKFQKAWNQFSAVIHFDPNCHTAYDGRAIVCLQMGDTFAAFQDTNAALKIVTNAELLTNRGVINQFMGYLSCAMKDYQQAITIDSGYALAYFNAANIYFLNRQFSQAYDYYSKALMFDPKNESAFLNRAITNTLLKNFEEAKADFEKAICLSPFSAAIYFNKANLYNTLKEYEQADEDISKALSIQPYDALMYKLRADIRGKMGLIKEAIADYKKAISIQELISTG